MNYERAGWKPALPFGLRYPSAPTARHDAEMPISAMLHAVLFEGKEPQAGIVRLMSREPKGE